MTRRTLSFLVLILGLFALVGATLWVNRPDTSTKPSAIGGAFSLIDEAGASVTEAAFRGKVSLVFFGYTHCPDVCPTTLYDMSQILAKIPAEAPVAAAFITVDPERDTPAVLKDYLSSFDPRIHGFSGPRANVEAAMRAYRIYAKKVPGSNAADYTYDHTALVYLIDRKGGFVTGLDLNRPPAENAAQITSYF